MPDDLGPIFDKLEEDLFGPPTAAERVCNAREELLFARIKRNFAATIGVLSIVLHYVIFLRYGTYGYVLACAGILCFLAFLMERRNVRDADRKLKEALIAEVMESLPPWDMIG